MEKLEKILGRRERGSLEWILVRREFLLVCLPVNPAFLVRLLLACQEFHLVCLVMKVIHLELRAIRLVILPVILVCRELTACRQVRREPTASLLVTLERRELTASLLVSLERRELTATLERRELTLVRQESMESLVRRGCWVARRRRGAQWVAPPWVDRKVRIRTAVGCRCFPVGTGTAEHWSSLQVESWSPLVAWKDCHRHCPTQEAAARGTDASAGSHPETAAHCHLRVRPFQETVELPGIARCCNRTGPRPQRTAAAGAAPALPGYSSTSRRRWRRGTRASP